MEVSILEENLREFRNFPEALRSLVEDELEAGNQIVEFGHGFPAAPCGAYIKLALPVSTRKRQATAELDFYDRNSSSYAGEFTDAKRHFFVLEPPRPPSPAPDMDAIRAAIDAEYAANEALQARGSYQFVDSAEAVPATGQREAASDQRLEPTPASVVHRFTESMEINYDKWREGEGYDLTLIEQADQHTRDSLERILIGRSPIGWRDIQALAKINSPKARAAIMDAFLHADTQTRMAVHVHAPELLSEPLRIDSIVRALQESTIYFGLSEALAEVEQFHPPEIVRELMRGLMRRDGGTACHFAAMLYFVHGKSSCAFDWEHRPFFLKFNTEDLVEREKAVRELGDVIGVDPII